MIYSIKTSIPHPVIKNTLIKGSCLSALGIGIFLYCLIYIPAEQLRGYGFFAFLGGSFCIGLGLIPFKRLLRLQLFPNRLDINHDLITYIQQGEAIFSFKKTDIARADYYSTSNKQIYGIGIEWNHQSALRILKKKEFQKITKKAYGYDVFLPFFKKDALTKL